MIHGKDGLTHCANQLCCWGPAGSRRGANMSPKQKQHMSYPAGGGKWGKITHTPKNCGLKVEANFFDLSWVLYAVREVSKISLDKLVLI